MPFAPQGGVHPVGNFGQRRKVAEIGLDRGFGVQVIAFGFDDGAGKPVLQRARQPCGQRALRVRAGRPQARAAQIRFDFGTGWCPPVGNRAGNHAFRGRSFAVERDQAHRNIGQVQLRMRRLTALPFQCEHAVIQAPGAGETGVSRSGLTEDQPIDRGQLHIAPFPGRRECDAYSILGPLQLACAGHRPSRCVEARRLEGEVERVERALCGQAQPVHPAPLPLEPARIHRNVDGGLGVRAEIGRCHDPPRTILVPAGNLSGGTGFAVAALPLEGDGSRLSGQAAQGPALIGAGHLAAQIQLALLGIRREADIGLHRLRTAPAVNDQHRRRQHDRSGTHAFAARLDPPDRFAILRRGLDVRGAARSKCHRPELQCAPGACVGIGAPDIARTE